MEKKKDRKLRKTELKNTNWNSQTFFFVCFFILNEWYTLDGYSHSQPKFHFCGFKKVLHNTKLILKNSPKCAARLSFSLVELVGFQQRYFNYHQPWTMKLFCEFSEMILTWKLSHLKFSFSSLLSFQIVKLNCEYYCECDVMWCEW